MTPEEDFYPVTAAPASHVTSNHRSGVCIPQGGVTCDEVAICNALSPSSGRHQHPPSQGWISFFDLRFKLMTSHTFTLTQHLLGDGVRDERSRKWHVSGVEIVMMVVLLSHNCTVVTQMKRCWKDQQTQQTQQTSTDTADNTHNLISWRMLCFCFIESSQKHDYLLFDFDASMKQMTS